MELIKSISSDPDFKFLVNFLDAYLKIIDGEDHVFYASHNKLEDEVDVIICYIENIPVGCGAFKIISTDTVEIKRMYVQPEYRGKGIAVAILQALENWAKALNYKYCKLETGNRMQDAIALYKKAGYAIIPNYDQYIGVANSVCMSKSII
jgi:putative acetyltransferase